MLSKVPAKVHEINNKAFDLGLEYARQVSGWYFIKAYHFQ
jgi:2-oxoglutarate ferredoxin oxidoreductase subunit gamma